MEGKRTIAQRLARAADLPDEPIPGLSLIEIAGDQRVLVEHHKGVIQYGQEEIRIRTGFGEISVTGLAMTLTKMTKGQLIISGEIRGIGLFRGC